MNQQIPGGSFIVARKLFESEVWIKNPLYLKLWIWILGQANHSDHQKHGRAYSKGEFFTTYDKMILATAYYQNRKHIVPTIKQIRVILNWLQLQGMIFIEPVQVQRPTGADPGARTGAYLGIKIVVVNYDTYQDLKSYKGRDKGRPSVQQGHNNKNVKNVLTTTSLENDNSVPFKEILEEYHKTLPKLPKVRVFSDKRKRMLKARWKEDKRRQTVKWWEGYFNYVKDSDFLMGKESKFCANFEWLINASNVVKVTEGNYN